ncbi:hypothetical protein AAC387_Pa06g2340 [Persea americana]
MKFLALVSCCWASVQPPPPRRREEARALVPLPCEEGDTCRSAKRRKRGSLAWRPSLVAISEDSVASGGPTRAGDRTVGSRKGLAGKDSSGSSSHKIRLRDDSDRFGHSTVLPAFSPTAFLF